MGFLNKIFGKKEQQVKNYGDFWEWFKNNEQVFYNVVKSGKDIETDFFDRMSPKLKEVKDGIFFLTGMCDEHTAELIFTPDRYITNIVFVEELVNAAPTLTNWSLQH